LTLLRFTVTLFALKDLYIFGEEKYSKWVCNCMQLYLLRCCCFQVFWKRNKRGIFSLNPLSSSF
jgi:hypothetical protein